MPHPFLRYHRQMLLPGVGDLGQQRLARAHAVVVGVGALGCVSADLLARAGVGTLTLVDRDLVELTNLQRQTLYTEQDALDAMPKAIAAAQRLRSVNGAIRIEGVVADASPATIEPILKADALRPRPDVILDGTDNFETRYLLNDFAVRYGIPLVYAGVIATRAMQLTIIPGETPCLRCIFEQPPPAGGGETCDTVGVLAPAAATAAAIQASEAIRILLALPPSPHLLELDLWAHSERRLNIAGMRREDCPCCAQGRFEFLDGSRVGGVVTICGRDAFQVSPPSPTQVDPRAMLDRLAAMGEFTANRFVVRGTLRGQAGSAGREIGLAVFADGRTIVTHARDAAHARAIVARFVGT